ncbi:MAG: serine/threonine-protein kinase [Rudaea sp.]|uniref:serine/threonine-protein kinase n=1 Tax=Rudaea sp. TaxID=2136325 RepID=UPI0039E25A1F
MTDSRRALALFDRVVALDAPSRAALLDAECGGDETLRREVEELVGADGRARDFLCDPLVVGDAAPGDRSDELLGAYRLVALVGSGGMGSVYRAQRADGAFDKPVAIKLLVFDAGDLRARFAREQRILGNLDHAHIARLLDVGRDANGAPFLVMEYVDGVPITRHARERALSLRARVELFLPVLDAVQSAHAQLVVHRDIKPGNVLVDAHGNAKLLDFGIAKLLDNGGGAATRTGIGPLTPEYASPEQVRGEPVGTPSDVYSLGMLLYELVCGVRPYAIADTSPTGIERAVCESEPMRPSLHFADADGGNARDLDAVLLKALEKKPAQRYASCAEFAADLKRWLAREAVIAREPSRRERLARYVRRHRLGVSVAAAASLALLVGLAVALWQARVALQAQARAEEMNRFLLAMFDAADPDDLGRNTPVGTVLDRAGVRAERELAGDPLLLAQIQSALANAYFKSGDLDNAAREAQAQIASADRSGDMHARILARIGLGNALIHASRLDEARKNLDAARDLALAADERSLLGQTENSFGALANQLAQPDEALRHYSAALADLGDGEGDIEARAEALNGLALDAGNRGQWTRAIGLHEQSLALLGRLYPDGSVYLVAQLGNLATELESAGRHDEAERKYAEGLAMGRRLVGENDSQVVNLLANWTFDDTRRGDAAAALAHGEQAYRAAQPLAVRNNAQAAYAMSVYAGALILAQRYADALPVVDECLRIREAILAPDHPLRVSTRNLRGLVLAHVGRVDEGAALVRETYETLHGRLGDDHPLTRVARERLAEVERIGH